MPKKIEPSNWINAGFRGLVRPIDNERRAAISNALGVAEISDEVVDALQQKMGELIGNTDIDSRRPTASQSKEALNLIQGHAKSLHQILFNLDDVSMDFLVSHLLKKPGKEHDDIDGEIEIAMDSKKKLDPRKELDAVYAEFELAMDFLKKLNRAAGSAILSIDEKVKIGDDVVTHRHKFKPPQNRPLRIFIAELAHIYKEVTGKKPTGYYSDVYEIKGKFFLFVESCLACLPDDAYPNNARPSDIAIGQMIKETLQAIKITI